MEPERIEFVAGERIKAGSPVYVSEADGKAYSVRDVKAKPVHTATRDIAKGELVTIPILPLSALGATAETP